MSNEVYKFSHSRRILKSQSAMMRQKRIAQSHGLKVDVPHKLAKKHAMTCGDSKCVMCGNPRKFFGEPTIQEKSIAQRQLYDYDEYYEDEEYEER